jgi:uncharacterized protein with GYD domain
MLVADLSGGAEMPKYVAFFSYTSEGWRRMIENPGDRAAAARNVVEGLGGTMECLYWMTGEHDGLVIFDAPDVVSAGAASVGATSSGLITSKLQQLLDMDDAAALLDKARAVVAGFQPPGG